jgi:TolA-binding protein
MSRNIKLTLYVLLSIAVIWTGINFFSRLKQSSTATEAAVLAETNEVVEAAETNAVALNAETNSTTDTNLVATNVIAASTNAVAQETNVVVEATNAVPVAADTPPAAPPSDTSRRGMTGAAGMIGALVKFAAALLCLAGLIAYDVSHYLSNRTIDFVFNDNLKGVRNEEYEAAEQMYANGKPLDAIQMMREYLRKNPREQHVALRIAEIYETDLKNDLAAALEYEQVLEKKLPPERWGWAAIHLCNIYSRMGKTDQTVKLLRRIADEYGETAAAKKARKRLAMFELGDETSLGVDMPEDPNMPNAPTPAPRSQPKVAKVVKEEPPSNLPPGFRPKK